MQYRLRTLMILLAVGPPLLAFAWLWCRQLIVDGLILLMCELLAAAMLISILAVVGLAWTIAKRAAGVTRALLQLIPTVSWPSSHR